MEEKTREAYKYDPKYHDAWAFSLAIKGATDDDIAKAFGVNRRTIMRWAKTKDGNEEKLTSFGEALRAGKEQADAKVEVKLFERCMGCETTEVIQTIEYDDNGAPIIKGVKTIKKQHPPDTMGIMYWLNNRFRATGEWSQKQERATKDAELLDGYLQAMLPGEQNG